MAPHHDDTLLPAGELYFRYEDFAQDGRPLLRALPPSLGAVWRTQINGDAAAQRLRAAGIIPILTRIEIDLGDDSFAPFRPGEVSGKGALSAADVPAGEYARVLFDLHGRVEARTGHALLPHGPSETRVVGTLLGEHVLTRLFAEKGARRVEAADLAPLGIAVEKTRVWRPPQSIVVAPDGAAPLTPGFVRDPVPTVFGLMHTDANQHVNSLVYPQLFEEAVLRRLASLGRDVKVVARNLRVGYRKPSFAGETVAIDVALFERAGRTLAVGRFVGAGEDDPERARVYVRMELAG
jgi:hypothetical protein